jgi:hypothetical protein
MLTGNYCVTRTQHSQGRIDIREKQDFDLRLLLFLCLDVLDLTYELYVVASCVIIHYYFRLCLVEWTCFQS